jgi:hypothetical protein
MKGKNLDLVYVMQQYHHDDLIADSLKNEAKLISSWTIEKKPFKIKLKSLLKNQIDDIKEAYVIVRFVVGNRIFESYTFPTVELKRETHFNQLNYFQKM